MRTNPAVMNSGPDTTVATWLSSGRAVASLILCPPHLFRPGVLPFVEDGLLYALRRALQPRHLTN